MDKAQILRDFEDNKLFERLQGRRVTFFRMIEHLVSCEKPAYIIETGTAWDQDNWEGQGQSTLIWDWLAERNYYLQILSIDLNPAAAQTARPQTRHVKYITADSVKTLNSLPIDMLSQCRLLYLDSFDWSPEANLDSAFHHMAELATVWAHLPGGCMIVVDDRHGPQKGKHFMVEYFMEKLGIKPAFSEYQIGWIKL